MSLEPSTDLATDFSTHRSNSDSTQVDTRERLRHYELILDRTPVLIAYVGADRRFHFASQAYCERHLLHRNEVIGRKVLDVIGEDALSALGFHIDGALQGEEQRFEIIFRSREGEARWVNASYVPDRAEDGSIQGFFAFIQDVHDRKAVEESQARFQYAVDQGMEGFSLHDKDGNFTYLNPAQATMYGYTSEEVIGNNWRMLYDCESIREIETVHLPVLMREGKWRGEMIGRKKTGEAFDVEVSLTLLRGEQGNTSGLVCNCRDITERKLAEASLRQLHKMEALGQLTGGIAHDFNNLLTVILGNLDLMRHRAPGNVHVEHALEAVHRGAMLTKRLLMFSRKQPLRPRAIDLDELIKGMDDLMRRSLGERIDIRVVGGDHLELCESDPSVLENAVLNLAVNARDAMPHGGTLTIETANARADELPEIENPPGAEFVRLSVADSGTGVPNAIKKRIFEPFFTTKAPGRGSGLGLSMVRDFVLQSSGHITLNSEVGQGTTFNLYLPRSRRTELRPALEAAAATPGGRLEVILVVEDDPNVRRLVVQMLSDLGYRAHAAEDASEAIPKFSEHQAALLLTDVVLPGGLDGPELATKIWQRQPQAKIIFMSGYNENLHLHETQCGRKIHLILKPFTQQELARTVRTVLEAPNEG